MSAKKRRPNDELLEDLFAQNCRLVEIISTQKQMIARQRESSNFLRATVSQLAQEELQMHGHLNDLFAKQLRRHAAVGKER